MRWSRLKRGVRISRLELARLGVCETVGVRFRTDLLEVHPAEFEVIEIEEEQAVVRRISYVDAAGRALV